MSIRDLVVSIDFDDIDLRRLLQVDTAMDEIEDSFNRMGGDIDDAAGEFNRMGSTSSGALNEIRTEANQAGDAMGALGSEAQHAGQDASNAMDDAGNSAEDAGEQAERAGGGFNAFGKLAVAAVAAVTTAIAGATTAIGLFVTETDTAFDRFAAKTGTSGHELVELGEVAKNVYKGAFGESILQVTDDVAKLNSMFGHLDYGELQTLAEGAYTIADLWDQEVGQVGKTVKTMTATFKGLSESDAMDLMTTAFQKTGDYSDDLLDTFNEYSVYFQKMGFDAKDFTNILIKGADAGAFTMDKAADAIKEFGIRSIDASEATADGFKLVGLDAEHMTKQFAAGGDTAQKAFAATVAGLAAMDDPVKQNAAGVALFGTQWEDLRETVILSMTDGKDAVGDFKGATKEAADTAYDNFGTRMTGVFRDLKLKIVDAFKDNGGEKLMADIATKAEELVPKIEAVVGKAVEFAGSVQDNWPAIKETTIGIATAVGVFAVGMQALSIIGTINTLLAAYRAGTLMATAAQMGLNLALLANPMTWVVAGIAALIGIGVALYRNWDTVKIKAVELWGTIKDNPLAWIVAGPIMALINAGIYVYKNFDTIKAKAGELWQKLLDNPMLALVGGPIGALVAAGIGIYKNFDTIKSKAGELWQKFLDNPMAALVSGPIGGLIAAGATLYNKFDDIKAAFNRFKDAIASFKMPGWVSSIGSTLSSAASKVKGLFDGSHATGLEYVPFDGYRAELHKGEAVLTAQQADALRNTGMLDSVGDRPKLSLYGEREAGNGNAAGITPTAHNGGVEIAKTSSNNTVNNQTFAPSITVNVEKGPNGEMDENMVSAAVKRELEKFWIAMNLKEA